MKKKKSLLLSVIVPVYNEAKNIEPFLNRIKDVLNKMNLTHEILFCMDPSKDNTESVIESEIQKDSNIKLIIFSRRFGQPAATMAGILHCHGDICVVMDVDLQDPPELIEKMHQKMQEGYEVVYAKRISRKGETLIKRVVSYLGYAIINKLSDVPIPRNTGDFRMITRRVIEELRRLHETHGFLRGLVSYVGFKQAFIEYDRHSRHSGQGNYNRFFGSIKIGLNGLISFSSRPLQLMSVLGAILAGLGFLLGLWYVFQKINSVRLTPGLSTTVVMITFFAGIQLLCLGLIGEYIARIYDEVKQRPQFIIDKVVGSVDMADGADCSCASVRSKTRGAPRARRARKATSNAAYAQNDNCNLHRQPCQQSLESKIKKKIKL